VPKFKELNSRNELTISTRRYARRFLITLLHPMHHDVEKGEVEKMATTLSPITILRTELSGYDAVGAELLIVGMGFNQGRIQQ
jgi:hypothetical protein